MTIAKHIKILFYESASFKFKIFVISKFEPFGMQYSSQREDKSQIRSIYRFNFCSAISVFFFLKDFECYSIVKCLSSNIL